MRPLDECVRVLNRGECQNTYHRSCNATKEMS
jgi:hypothetical protein